MIKDHKIPKKAVFHLLYLIIGLIFNSRLQAQNLTVSPINTQIQVSGGEEKFLEYTLTNESQASLIINLEARSFQPDDLYGQPLILANNDFPYLSLIENNREASAGVKLLPKSSKKIQVKFAPPLGVAEKEFPLTLFFVASPEKTPRETEINFKIGSNVIIRTDKSNLDKSQLEIEEVLFPLIVDSFVPQKKQIKINNLGNTSTLIKGGAVLKRKSGTVIKSWEFHPDLVLGESSRLARGKNVVDVVGNIALLSEFEFPLPLIGEYILEVQAYSGYALADVVRPKIYNYSFIALPYWLMLVVSIVLLLILLISYIIKGGKNTQSKKELREKVDAMKAQKDFFDDSH